MVARRRLLNPDGEPMPSTSEPEHDSPCAFAQVLAERVENLEQYEEKQNGSLQRIEKQVDRILQGYLDGTLGPYQPLLRRHVALICERARLECALSVYDYTPATRADVRDSILGLTWLEERWEEGITRGQLARLIWRSNL